MITKEEKKFMLVEEGKIVEGIVSGITNLVPY